MQLTAAAVTPPAERPARRLAEEADAVAAADDACVRPLRLDVVVSTDRLKLKGGSMSSASITTSARGVILTGQNYVDVELCLPRCPKGEEFLVQGVHVGPEIETGATSQTVQYLQLWGVSVPVYQRYANGGSLKVSLTAISAGPQHVWASIPAGQSWPFPGPLPVRIFLLSGGPAQHRFEFNIHITGIYGEPFVCRCRTKVRTRAKRR